MTTTIDGVDLNVGDTITRHEQLRVIPTGSVLRVSDRHQRTATFPDRTYRVDDRNGTLTGENRVLVYMDGPGRETPDPTSLSGKRTDGFFAIVSLPGVHVRVGQRIYTQDEFGNVPVGSTLEQRIGGTHPYTWRVHERGIHMTEFDDRDDPPTVPFPGRPSTEQAEWVVASLPGQNPPGEHPGNWFTWGTRSQWFRFVERDPEGRMIADACVTVIEGADATIREQRYIEHPMTADLAWYTPESDDLHPVIQRLLGSVTEAQPEPSVQAGHWFTWGAGAWWYRYATTNHDGRWVCDGRVQVSRTPPVVESGHWLRAPVDQMTSPIGPYPPNDERVHAAVRTAVGGLEAPLPDVGAVYEGPAWAERLPIGSQMIRTNWQQRYPDRVWTKTGQNRWERDTMTPVDNSGFSVGNYTLLRVGTGDVEPSVTEGVSTFTVTADMAGHMPWGVGQEVIIYDTGRANLLTIGPESSTGGWLVGRDAPEDHPEWRGRQGWWVGRQRFGHLLTSTVRAHHAGFRVGGTISDPSHWDTIPTGTVLRNERGTGSRYTIVERSPSGGHVTGRDRRFENREGRVLTARIGTKRADGWFVIESLPDAPVEFTVEGGFRDHDHLMRLPVGARIRHRDTGTVWTREGDGRFVSGAGTHVQGSGFNYQMYVLDHLPAGETGAPTSHPVGTRLNRENIASVPVGTVIRYGDNTPWQKIADNQWQARHTGHTNPSGPVLNDSTFWSIGYVVIETPGSVTEAPEPPTPEVVTSTEPDVQIAVPDQTRLTLPRYKQRFRTLAFGAQQRNSVSEGAVRSGMESLGVPDYEPGIGMVIDPYDNVKLESMPAGTVIAQGDPQRVDSLGVWTKSRDYGGWTHLLGRVRSMNRGGPLLRIIGMPTGEQPGWLMEEWTEATPQQILEFKNRAREVGMALKSQERWCGVAEQTMNAAGINPERAFARPEDDPEYRYSAEAAAALPVGTVFRVPTDHGVVYLQRSDAATNASRTVRIGGSAPGTWAVHGLQKIGDNLDRVVFRPENGAELEAMPVGAGVASTPNATRADYTKREDGTFCTYGQASGGYRGHDLYTFTVITFRSTR